MEKYISGGTIPAKFLGNQMFVSGQGCGLQRDTDALIWKLCVSLFHWTFLTCSRVVCVAFFWASVWLQERCCVLCSPRRAGLLTPNDCGCSTGMQQVKNLCIIKHIHVRTRKVPQDLKCMWVSTPLFLYLCFQGWLTQLISFFSSSSFFFFFISSTAIFLFLANGCAERQLFSTQTDLFHYIHLTMVHSGKMYVPLPPRQSFPFMALKGHNQETVKWESEMLKVSKKCCRSCANNQRHIEVENTGEENGTWPSASAGKEKMLRRNNINFFRCSERHKWQQHAEINRGTRWLKSGTCFWPAALTLNSPVAASPGRTAEVCSAGSQKGFNPLGLTCIRTQNVWTAVRDVLERAGSYCLCSAWYWNNSFHFDAL